jgi:hypothetical protein
MKTRVLRWLLFVAALPILTIGNGLGQQVVTSPKIGNPLVTCHRTELLSRSCSNCNMRRIFEE